MSCFFEASILEHPYLPTPYTPIPLVKNRYLTGSRCELRLIKLHPSLSAFHLYGCRGRDLSISDLCRKKETALSFSPRDQRYPDALGIGFRLRPNDHDILQGINPDNVERAISTYANPPPF